jgi:DNA-binding transcriptional MocR family regulator
MRTEGLVDVLGRWTDGSGPLHRRLADALRAAIEDGRLAGGTLLPPERQVAAALAVSRSTVAAALEALKDAGLLEARQGSGTWVRGRPRADLGNAALVRALEEHAIVRDLSGAPTSLVELTAAAVTCAPEVVATSAALDCTDVARASLGHGYGPQGLLDLREVVAERLTAIGLPTTPAQLLVTTGATQATLLAGRLFSEPDAPVVVEQPSYAGAIDVLAALGAKLLPLGIDASGARTDLLGELLARALPRLVYLVPDFHNPVGVVLSERRRAEVARLAAEYHVPVVEDLVQRDLWLREPPPPPIASFDPEAPILTVGSMSKVFWGGLRIGWVRAHEPTIASLARIKAVTDFGSPVLPQLVSARLLAEAAHDGDALAARRRAELSSRLDVLEEALRAELPDWRWDRPAGGLSLWVRLPEPRADELVRRALEHGVDVVPGTTFAVGQAAHADRIRIPFVADPDVIREGVRRLGEAWRSLDAGTARRRVPAVVV